jgi:NAD(P)-dependent dehydrogenase (short-subunit alcohol dehydrogenase family)
LDADNSDAREQFNVVIVGTGAIGSAMARDVLKRHQAARVVMLGRSNGDSPRDSRLTFVAFDASDPDSIVAGAAAVEKLFSRVHLLINTVGLLHSESQQPEKNLRAIRADNLQRSFQVNAILLPLLAQAFSRHLRHEEPAALVSLSARVGSIEDNKMGGWYGYRASKAAHNMLLKTLAREWRISHRNVTVVALHPGTVRSRLSQPFLNEKSYPKRILTPDESAQALLGIIEGLAPAESGSFLDWQGKAIPW